MTNRSQLLFKRSIYGPTLSQKAAWISTCPMIFFHTDNNSYSVLRAHCASQAVLSLWMRQLAGTCKKQIKLLYLFTNSSTSVDSETDTLMQTVIRTHFKEQTLIAIVHKLHTILDFDKVALIEKGQVVEFDTPQALLSREGSAFRALFNSFHKGSKE